MYKSFHQATSIKDIEQIVLYKLVKFFNASESALQNLVEFRSSLKEEEKILFDILSTFIIKSESSSPKASKIFFDRLTGERIEKKNSRCLSRDDLNKLLENYAKKDNLKIIKDALELAGLKGKIVFGKSFNSHTIVELTKSFVFENLQPSFYTGKLDIAEPKLICIDGYIESVSEIHHVLEKASSLKEPIVVFVRGLSEEVNHTLKVNFDRKTLIFIPVVVPYDLDGANLLNDIMTISGGDVVSTLKGNLISSIDPQIYPRIESISFVDGVVSIVNNSATNRVDQHIKFLQTKILGAENDATLSALKKRIQRLGSNQVTLHIPEDSSYIKNVASIDNSIRAIKAASTFGVCEYNNSTLPVSSVEAGIFYAEQYKKLLGEIGCIVC